MKLKSKSKYMSCAHLCTLDFSRRLTSTDFIETFYHPRAGVQSDSMRVTMGGSSLISNSDRSLHHKISTVTIFDTSSD